MFSALQNGILARFGWLYLLATSLGFGAMQIKAGLGTLSSVPTSVNAQVLIIAAITGMATVSVVAGLHKGVQRLSMLNMSLAGLLLAFSLFSGPTTYFINVLFTGIGSYLQNIVFSSFWLDPRPGSEWQANWTLFYWSWWISWSPFVGVFVARMSQGRTVREFVLSVVFVPTVATFVWPAVFGGTGLKLQSTGGALAEPILDSSAIALHTLLAKLPLSEFTGVCPTVLIILFFVTSSDSGSFVEFRFGDVVSVAHGQLRYSQSNAR